MDEIQIPMAYTFDDILLVPQYSEVVVWLLSSLIPLLATHKCFALIITATLSVPSIDFNSLDICIVIRS